MNVAETSDRFSTAVVRTLIFPLGRRGPCGAGRRVALGCSIKNNLSKPFEQPVDRAEEHGRRSEAMKHAGPIPLNRKAL